MRTRKPSIKSLRPVFGQNAPAAKALLHATREQLIATPAGARRSRECFATPETWDLRMECLNELRAFFGVEYIRTSNGAHATYLNSGDMYFPTLIFWKGRYRVQSIGDFVETMERRGVRFE